MSLSMGTIVTRLQASCPTLQGVASAAAASVILDEMRGKSPIAIVVPLAEGAGVNELATSALRQRVTQEFAVMIGLKNVRDARGDAAMTDLEPVRDAVSAALLNWQPSGEFAPLERGDGSLVDYTDGVLWWQDTYRTEFYIQA